MHDFLAALQLPFMQRALEAGLLIGVCVSYYGVFIVQRGLAFMGDGLAHAAFGGVALGLLLGGEPLWVALPFTVLVALGIAWLRERTTLGGDTVIGVFFALSVALGIVFMSLRQTYSQDAMAYLFGSIMAVTPADLWASRIALLLACASLPLWGRWASASFDRESARADGLAVGRHDMLLLALVALTVVVAVKVVGIVLLSAFLVVPAASARLVARRFAGMTLLAAGLGAVTALGGLCASYFLNTPSGATIVLAQCAVFVVAYAAQGRRWRGRIPAAGR
jgi:zinc transport system permease protein